MPSNSAGLIACLIFGLAEAAVRAPDKDADCEQMPENEACAEYRGHSQLSSALLQRKHNIYQQQALAEEGMALESEKVKESETRPVEEALLESDGLEEELSELAYEEQQLTKFQKQDSMIQEDVENTADEEDWRPSPFMPPNRTRIRQTYEHCLFCKDWYWKDFQIPTSRCPSELLALCDKHSRALVSCGRINHRIVTTNSNLCVPKSGGGVIYKGQPCGENAEISYVSEAEKRYYAQNVQWVSAKADDIRSGMSEAQCEWTWGADREFYAGSCGVEPQVATINNTHFPNICWPDEIAKEKEQVEKRSLEEKIVKLKSLVQSVLYANRRISHLKAFSLATPLARMDLAGLHNRERCGEIYHKIVTTNSNLCVHKHGGPVIYKGKPCGENTEISYESESGETHYAQNIQWVSAKATHLREGLSKAQCEWTWGAGHEFYAGSCGVLPQVATIKHSDFPKTCWPEEIAKEKDRLETQSLEESKERWKAEIASFSLPSEV